MKLAKLKTLRMTEPLGIDVTPYFSWILESDTPNTLQASYRLTVAAPDSAPCYDSGVVESDHNAYIPYAGPALHSRTRYTWTVTVTDNHGNEASASSTFETALLGKTDWSAQWVKPAARRKKAKKGFGKQQPATLFRKVFTLKEKPASARLYATCHGVYELYLNGHKPDERTLAPEHTVYEKYLCYQTYDVTQQLLAGDNVLGMAVGDGWYLGPHTTPNMKHLDYAHAVLFQLEVTYADGSCEHVISDNSVKTAFGPVRSSDLFAGECYDANFEQQGWCAPGFDEKDWTPVKTAAYGYANLVAQLGEPVTVVKELPVSQILTSPIGETILDFGQVIAGRVRMKVNAPKGTAVTLEHCEVLDKAGNYFNNIQTAGGVGSGVDQKDVYISSGRPDVYEPHFTYHGFRYVRVSGIQPQAEDFTACVLSSQKEDIGSFTSSDEQLNRLYQNIRWSQCANMLSIPTDCPQREKAGWTGDMLVYAKTAMLNEDCTAFFTRWLHNMRCDQDQYGIVPMVVPQVGTYPMMGKFIHLTSGCKGSGTSSGWGDAAVAVPYSMYQVTGNTAILRQQYTCMKRWCDYVIDQAATRKPKGSTLPPEIEMYLWDTGYHYGEWLIPSQNKNGLDMKNLKGIMGMSSCYTAPIFGWNSVNTFAAIAGILAEEDKGNAQYQKDAESYGHVAQRMENAIQKGVIRPDGSMPSDLMGAYVLPIYFDLVPEEHKTTFAQNLVQSIKKNGMCMDTGFLGTPYLLDALCKIGRQDLAYTLLWQTEKPSWLYEVAAGGTTIWENCYGYDEDGNPGNLSFNHYAFGAVADWIFRNVTGIDSADAGFRHLIFAPKPDGKLTHAHRRFETSQGTAEACWDVEDSNTFKLQVKVPCNATALVRLPDGTEKHIGSGSYIFEVPFL